MNFSKKVLQSVFVYLLSKFSVATINKIKHLGFVLDGNL